MSQLHPANLINGLCTSEYENLITFSHKPQENYTESFLLQEPLQPGVSKEKL